MFKFLRRVQEQTYTPSADEVKSFDLGVNPLSHIQLAIRPLNDTGTLANFPSYLSLMDAINRVSVIWNGVTIISGSGRDAGRLEPVEDGVRHGGIAGLVAAREPHARGAKAWQVHDDPFGVHAEERGAPPRHSTAPRRGGPGVG